MAAQIDREHRLAAADDVLHNAGTLDAIAPQVEALDRRYRELVTASRAST
jgi:dephospho-CoA kinase